LLLLVAEVGALTARVEIATGAVQYVANARVCAALLFALVALLLLAGGAAGTTALPRTAAGRLPALAWLAANGCLFAVFFLFNVRLEGGPAPSTAAWLVVPAWLLLAGAVGLTCLLAFFPPPLLWSWAWRCRGQALLAAGLGAALFLLGPPAQALWPRVAGPALAVDHVLLTGTYGHAVTGRSSEGVPVVGTRRLLLLVTPQCSELDALAAFGLLAAAVLAARWREARKVHFALVLLLGPPLLYLLNAARIYGLVVVGLAVSPRACVSLAHSRVGGTLFLGVTAALLSLTLRPRRPLAAPAVESRAG
jgi:exosortase/archaeosortase family protein